MELPKLLTEARAKNPVQVVLPGTPTESSVRAVPYVDRYHDQTGLTETPEDRLQRAADEQEQREDGED
jgi:hypothetical protein